MVAFTTPEKGWGYMNLTKIRVCVCIWRREIYESENKKDIGGVQPGGRYATRGVGG